MRFVLCLLLLPTYLAADLTYRDRYGRALDIRIARNVAEVLPARDLVVDSFFDIYRLLPPRVFDSRFRKPNQIRRMLNDAFDYEVASFLAGENIVLLGAIEGRLAAFLSFVDTGPDSIWVNQFAVATPEQRSGLGRFMLKVLVEDPALRPELESLSLSARRVNEKALGFYQKIGFVPSDELSEYIQHDRFLQLTLKGCGEALRSLRP